MEDTSVTGASWHSLDSDCCVQLSWAGPGGEPSAGMAGPHNVALCCISNVSVCMWQPDMRRTNQSFTFLFALPCVEACAPPRPRREPPSCLPTLLQMRTAASYNRLSSCGGPNPRPC
ncbi:hypothetical protein KUCAC02_002615, partial [Chaenocephalus aceratus]